MDEDRLAQLIATQLAAQSQRITETIEASERRQVERLDQVQDYARSLEQKINVLSSGGAGAGITQESYKEPRRITRRTTSLKKPTQTRESIVQDEIGEELHGIYEIDIQEMTKEH